MNILVLGAGGMGSVTARTVAEFPFVESVIIADLNVSFARQTAALIGAKATSAQVDVTDADSLRALCNRADLILNTVGPFYRFGVPVLQAAIHTGTHYADINDDWQPTLDMLALNDAAQQAGITAIIGLGASPGISNMLALEVARRLDTVDTLLTGWDTVEAMDDPAALDATPSAALIHWLGQISGKIRLHMDGKQTEATPLAEYAFHYPGYGEAIVWTVGHPEPITLPRRVPVRFSANVMTGNRDMMRLLQAIAAHIDSGALTLEAAAQEFLNEVMRSADEPLVVTGARLPSLFAIGFGQKDGQPLTVAATVKALPDGGMGGSTGVPLALAAALLHRGDFNKAGVFPPEDIIAPGDFFNLLAGYVPGGYADGEDLLEVTSGAGVSLAHMQPV